MSLWVQMNMVLIARVDERDDKGVRICQQICLR